MEPVTAIEPEEEAIITVIEPEEGANVASIESEEVADATAIDEVVPATSLSTQSAKEDDKAARKKFKRMLEAGKICEDMGGFYLGDSDNDGVSEIISETDGINYLYYYSAGKILSKKYNGKIDETKWIGCFNDPWGWEYVFPEKKGKWGNNITWRLDDSNRLVFTGTGDMWEVATGDWKPGWWYFTDDDQNALVKSIYISSGITNVGYDAFNTLYDVESVTLSKTVTHIDEVAFADCKKLKDIYYEGTKKQWNNIKIELGNYPIDDATIHYGTISNGFLKSGSKWIYVKDGVRQNKLTSLVKGKINGENGWYYVKNGIFTEATGLVKRVEDNRWFYVENGKFKKVKGLVKRVDNGKWCYVNRGAFTKANGICTRLTDGKSFYVENGKFKKSTGLAKSLHNKKWYYVKDGRYTEATGLVKRISDKKWFYVLNGRFEKDTCVARKAEGTDKKTYYVKNGAFSNITGTVDIAGKKFKVVKGVVK